MSSGAARSKNTSLLGEHYDKLAVVVVLTALLGSALFLWWRIGEAHRALTTAAWDRAEVGDRAYDPPDMEAFTAFVNRLEDPPQIQVRERDLMVSQLRVVSVNPDVRTPIPYHAMACPWTQYPQPEIGARDTTGDGIPDEWYVSHGLDPFDATLADRDYDGDWFTVRQEYEAGTSPVDPDDHPSYALQLRLRRTASRPFALRFEGVQQLGEDDVRFHLNDRRQNRSYFVRMGETVQGYRLVDYEERRVERPTGGRDASVLILEGPDGRRVELVINVDFSVEQRMAEMVFLLDESVYRVSEGDSITLRDNVYNVIDIGRDRVLLRDAQSAEEFRVERKTEAERRPREEMEDHDHMMIDEIW